MATWTTLPMRINTDLILVLSETFSIPNKHAPLRKKYLMINYSRFLNRELIKTMIRSKLEN